MVAEVLGQAIAKETIVTTMTSIPQRSLAPGRIVLVCCEDPKRPEQMDSEELRAAMAFAKEMIEIGRDVMLLTPCREGLHPQAYTRFEGQLQVIRLRGRHIAPSMGRLDADCRRARASFASAAMAYILRNGFRPELTGIYVSKFFPELPARARELAKRGFQVSPVVPTRGPQGTMRVHRRRTPNETARGTSAMMKLSAFLATMLILTGCYRDLHPEVSRLGRRVGAMEDQAKVFSLSLARISQKPTTAPSVRPEELADLRSALENDLAATDARLKVIEDRLRASGPVPAGLRLAASAEAIDFGKAEMTEGSGSAVVALPLRHSGTTPIAIQASACFPLVIGRVVVPESVVVDPTKGAQMVLRFEGLPGSRLIAGSIRFQPPGDGRLGSSVALAVAGYLEESRLYSRPDGQEISVWTWPAGCEVYLERRDQSQSMERTYVGQTPVCFGAEAGAYRITVAPPKAARGGMWVVQLADALSTSEDGEAAQVPVMKQAGRAALVQAVWVSRHGDPVANLATATQGAPVRFDVDRRSLEVLAAQAFARRRLPLTDARISDLYEVLRKAGFAPYPYPTGEGLLVLRCTNDDPKALVAVDLMRHASTAEVHGPGLKPKEAS